MKKILALVLALAMLLSVTAAMADGIKVGIINLDPSESGYREANVKDLNETFTAENGYDAKFVTACKKISSGAVAAPAVPLNASEVKKAEKPKSAASKTVPARTPLSADAGSVWNEMMARMQKTDITAWSFLSQGKLTGCNGHQYFWQAERREGEQQYITALNKAERNRTICLVLSEITGAECSFTAQKHDAAAADDGSDETYLKSIYETFGREPVDIVDHI